MNSRILFSLLAAASIAVAGCGDSSVQIDAAYDTVLTAQIANADNYSAAILKVTADPSIKRFARSVITARKPWSRELEASGDSDAAVSVSDAAKELNIPLASLAISASGTPLAAPSSDPGYLKAMQLNCAATLHAADIAGRSGSEATAQLAGEVTQTVTKELSELADLQK